MLNTIKQIVLGVFLVPFALVELSILVCFLGAECMLILLSIPFRIILGPVVYSTPADTKED